MSAPAEPAVEIPLREKNEAGSTPNENETKNLLTKEFEEYVAKLSKDFHVPGVSVAVVDGDKTYSTVGDPTLAGEPFSPLSVPR